jgi:hypothetical protein
MKNKLIEIAYTSRAPKLYSSAELLELLQQAKQYNQNNNITGLLLYKNGAFFQVLEGELNVIETLFVKISRDFRHYDVLKLYQSPLAQRHFSGWAMAFYDVSLLEADGLADKVPFGDGYLPFDYLQEELDGWAKPSAAKVLIEAFRANA